MITNDASSLRVLKIFAETNDIGFTDIAHALGLETDLTGYYLRKLQSKGLLEKLERGVYRITPLGKSVVIHSTQLSGLTTIPRVSIMIIGEFNDEYFVLERAKQPFIGTVEWPTYPLEVGVDLSMAASDALKSRLGIDATLDLKGFFRRIDVHNDIVFDDKLFAIHYITLTAEQKANVTKDSPMGKIAFQTLNELRDQQHASRSLIDILEFYKSDAFYKEMRYELKSEDLYKENK